MAKKYRIMSLGGGGYGIQEKFSFLPFDWSWMKNAWGISPAFKTCEEAEKALLAFLERQKPPQVVKEFEVEQ